MRKLKWGTCKAAILSLLSIAAIISVAAGTHDALRRSQDFQWSGAHMLLHHIDPWAEQLANNPHGYIYLEQHVNYLGIIYVLLLPLGALSLHHAVIFWAALNIVFALLSVWLAARFYGLQRDAALTLGVLFLMSTPFRTSLGNGQQSLLILFLFSASVLAHRLTDTRFAIAGVSYFKFNFAPPLALYLLTFSGLRSLLVSLLPCLAGLVTVWFILGHPGGLHGLLRLAAEPFEAARAGGYSRNYDFNLMDMLELVLNGSHWIVNHRDVIELAVATTFNIILFFRSRSCSAPWRTACLGLVACSLYRHHAYDAVTLLLPFAYFLSKWRERMAQSGLACIGFIFYVQRVVDPFIQGRARPLLAAFEFALLMVALAVLWQMRESAVRAA